MFKFLNCVSSALDKESEPDIGPIIASRWFCSFELPIPAIAPKTDDVSLLVKRLLPSNDKLSLSKEVVDEVPFGICVMID